MQSAVKICIRAWCIFLCGHCDTVYLIAVFEYININLSATLGAAAVEIKLQELSGTISREPACALAVREGRLYVQGESCFSAALEDPARFDRLSGYVPPAHRGENTLPCPTLQEIAFEASHRPDGWYLLIP